MTYSAIIDEVHKLTFDDKLMLKELLEKFLIEERRSQIYDSGQDALKSAQKGELVFTSDISEMKKNLQSDFH